MFSCEFSQIFKNTFYRTPSVATFDFFKVVKWDLNSFQLRLVESKMSMKILHFRGTSTSTICLLFPCNVALSHCFEISEMTLSVRMTYVLAENFILNKTRHDLYYMTDLMRVVGFPEAVAWTCFIKKMFLKRGSGTGVFL